MTLRNDHSDLQKQPSMIQNFDDLEVFKRSYQFALQMKKLSLNFPPEEKFSLTDQISRASRSIPANIAEGWAKRNFVPVFKRHLIDSIGSKAEIQVHLMMARDFDYISEETYTSLFRETDEIGKMLYALHKNWK